MIGKFYAPGSDTRSESLGWLLKRLKQSITAQAEVLLSEHGLTHAQWGALLMLRIGVPTSVACLVVRSAK